MLRIGKLSDYAIVVLAHMARHAHRCVHSATDLADETDVPLPTVQKVLKVLARGELVVSMRGARGGYALAGDPAHTSLMSILEVMEGPLALTECAVPHLGTCEDHERCSVGAHWPLINAAVREGLERVSLLDLARTRPKGSRAAEPKSHGASSSEARPGQPHGVDAAAVGLEGAASPAERASLAQGDAR